MNKKNYFYFLWALSSITSTIPVVLIFMGVLPIGQMIPPIGVVLALALLGITFDGFMVTMGIYFAQKIGARLLFLDGNYDYKKDILQPAIVTGVAISSMILIINAVLSNYSFFEKYSGVKFYIPLQDMIAVLNSDIFLLLCLVSGLALLIKKITKTSSVSVMFMGGIIVTVLLRNVFPLMWLFGTAIDAFNLLVINALIAIGIESALGVLFWKKGFETAVLYHFIIVLVFYLIAPMATSVIAA